MSQTALQEALLESATLNKARKRWKWTLTFVADAPEGFTKEHGVPSGHPLPAAREQDPRAVRPHYPRASQEQIALHTCRPTAPDVHPAAPTSGSSAAPPCHEHASPWRPDPGGTYRNRGRPSRSKGAEQGGVWALGAPTAPRLPWGPGLAYSACGRWRRPLSRGPREAGAPRGWKSPGAVLWAAGGMRWVALGRAALTSVCAAPRSGAFRSGDRPSLQLPFPQDRSWELRRPCASTLAPVASHACALTPAATHAWELAPAAAHAWELAPAATHARELAPAAAHSWALAPGPVGVGRGVFQPQDSWLEYPYFTFP